MAAGSPMTQEDMMIKYKIRSTTVLCVRRGNNVVIAGDGQVSLGDTVVKHSSRKVRRLGKDKNVLAGFAGSTADALTLLEKFEQMLDKYSNNLTLSLIHISEPTRPY